MTNPVQTLHDTARDFAVSLLTKAVMSVIGPVIANKALSHFDQSKSFSAQIPIHKKLEDFVLDDDFLDATTMALNDALYAPLAVLGVRIGECSLKKVGGDLQFDGVFQLAKHDAVSLLPSKTCVKEQQASP